MPVKIKRIFEHEYGKKRGDRIFYSWENKHRVMGVNLNKKISPNTYPIRKRKSVNVMGVNLKKSVPIKSTPIKKLNLFVRRN